jgi:hypothetical protein
MNKKRTLLLRIDKEKLCKHWDVMWSDIAHVFGPRNYVNREFKNGKRYVSIYYEMKTRKEAKDHVAKVNNNRDDAKKAKLLYE